MYRKLQPGGPPNPDDVIQIQTHGGLGDIVWIYKKLLHAEKPLYIRISEENKHRPRRSGSLVDHLPRVAGWMWAERTFAPNGDDWGPPNDPANAIGKTWEQIKPSPGYVLRLECNRHLESGRRLEDWLPDLKTTHHFEFDDPGPASLRFKHPYVIFHLAGWTDGGDDVWVNGINIFKGLAHVYVVGGSYDHRPRRIYEQVQSGSGVSILEDIAWPDLYHLLKGASYCFGHASGFTALADVLRVPGVVLNPRVIRRMIGTWNSTERPNQIHVNDAITFRDTVFAAYNNLAGAGTATWPPTEPRGPMIAAKTPDPLEAVRAASEVGPSRALVWYDFDKPLPGLAPAVLQGAYGVGKTVDSIIVIGTTAEAAQVYKESHRASRRPSIEGSASGSLCSYVSATADLVVVQLPENTVDACVKAKAAWANVARGGTLLFGGGGGAKSAAAHVAASLKVQPAEVKNCPGWYYIHRRA